MLSNSKIKIAIVVCMILLTVIIIVSLLPPKILQSIKKPSQITGNYSADKSKSSLKNNPIVDKANNTNKLNNNDYKDYNDYKNQGAQNAIISPTKTIQQSSEQQLKNQQTKENILPNLSKQYIPQYRPITITPTSPPTTINNSINSLSDLSQVLALFSSLTNSYSFSALNGQTGTNQNITDSDINQIINSIQPSPTPPTAIPIKNQLKKIGIYLMSDYSSGAKQIINAKPQIIKVMDPQNNSLLNAVKDYKKIFPNGVIVLRFYEATRNLKYTVNDDPTASAQDFHKKVIAPGLAVLGENKKLFDYIETPNELDSTPGWENPESIVWLTQFWEELINLNHQSGIKTCTASIPVGNPPGSNSEIKEKIRLFLPALIKTQQNNGVVCYHAYTLKYSQDLNEEIYTSLRYRLLHQMMVELDPSLINLRFILSEAGVDQNGSPQESGWQARGGVQQYLDWITWFDKQISQDNYVLGATLYQIGDNYWSSFNLEPIAGWIAGKL